MKYLFPNKDIKVKLIKDKDILLQAQMNIDLANKYINQEIDLINSKFGARSRSSLRNLNKDSLTKILKTSSVSNQTPNKSSSRKETNNCSFEEDKCSLLS